MPHALVINVLLGLFFSGVMQAFGAPIYRAMGGGWIAPRLTGELRAFFAVLALGLVVFGVTVTAAVRSGAWFR